MPVYLSLFEHIDKNYQFLVFLFSTFVLCMGIARWLGKTYWYELEKSRRKKLDLPVALLFRKAVALNELLPTRAYLGADW
jgi:hypothetical protein